MLTLEQSRALAARNSEPRTYGHFINGEWVDGASGKTIPLINPTNRAVLGHIQAGTRPDVERAVEAAYAAFPAWSNSNPMRRQELLLAIAQRLRERQADFAMMETLNNGKTIIESMGNVSKAWEQLEYFAGAGHHLRGEIIDYEDASVLVHREAIGVVAQIIPWNVSLLMAAQKLAPALVAGCTVVLKPAETVCLPVMELFKVIQDLLPRGVVNVVTGYGQDVGEALVSHPLVRKVSFTGSRPTAQKVMQYASMNIIPQTMELGGKSANIVCEDADLDAAAESAVITTVVNKGEVCLAGTRVFVHRKVRDAFVEKFSALLSTVRQGDPVDPSTQLGPQASELQFQRIQEYLEIGKAEGAVAHLGGKASNLKGLEQGFFIEPTIFTGVRNDMRIAQEEIFGPVTGILEWDDEADLVKCVNDSQYGLGGGLWTRDLTRAHRLTRAIETGTIWVNRYYNFRLGMHVGGYKQSGFGRENTLATLDHYTTTKSVVINLREGPLGILNAYPKPQTAA